MSWLPPFSRAGTVRAPSRAMPASASPVAVPPSTCASQRGQRQRRHPVGVGGDQRPFALVPAGQQLGRRRGAEQAGVGDPGVADARDVPRGGLLSAEVPDRLVRVGIVVGEEAAAVDLGEDAGVAPTLAGRVADLLRHRAEVEDVDDEQVAGLGALDRDRTGQHVAAVELDVADIVRRVVVPDLGVGPLAALDADRRAGRDRRCGRDVRVPAVVAGHRPGRASTWPGPR